jgi:hypothetical protein
MVLPMPPMDQKELAAWVASERPPAHDGDGHGDVLIWESLVAAAALHERTVLVSDDGDFADASGEMLDGHLRLTLQGVGPTPLSS